GSGSRYPGSVGASAICTVWFVAAARASAIRGLGRITGPRRRNSANAGGALRIAATRKFSPSLRYRTPNLASQMRVAFSRIVRNTNSRSPGDFEMRRKTSEVAVSRSSASSRSRRSRTNSLSWPTLEELLWRTVRAVRRFRVFALRLRALANFPLALERRRMAYPKAQDYADFQRGLQQGFATGGMGSDRHFA